MLNDSVTFVNWVSHQENLSPCGAGFLLNQATCTIFIQLTRGEGSSLMMTCCCGSHFQQDTPIFLETFLFYLQHHNQSPGPFTLSSCLPPWQKNINNPPTLELFISKLAEPLVTKWRVMKNVCLVTPCNLPSCSCQTLSIRKERLLSQRTPKQ